LSFTVLSSFLLNEKNEGSVPLTYVGQLSHPILRPGVTRQAIAVFGGSMSAGKLYIFEPSPDPVPQELNFPRCRRAARLALSRFLLDSLKNAELPSAVVDVRR
jgi:hypothetical protein